MDNIWIHGEENVFEEFKRMGYTDEEAKMLTELASTSELYNPRIGEIDVAMNDLVEKFNSIGCTSFYLTSDELRKLGAE